MDPKLKSFILTSKSFDKLQDHELIWSIVLLIKGAPENWVKRLKNGKREAI